MRCAMRPLLAAAVVCLGVGCSFGFGRNKIVYKNFQWRVYTSPHFQVHYYPEEEEFLQRIVSDAESSYVRLSKFLDHEINYKIPLIYYRTHGDFEQTNVDLSEIPQAVGAFAEPFQNRVVIPIDQPPDRFAAVLRHELTHIFEFSIFYGESLRRTIRSSPPLWIMEGLASYLGQDETAIDRMVIRDAVVNNYIPPLKMLDPQFVDGFLVYRFGHAIFDYIESAHGKEGVRNFLFEYRKVLLTNNVEKALKEAFGTDFDEFDRKFDKYLRKKYFPALLEKNEPLDYGKDIGLKKKGQYTFSPTLSPSGELVAALGTPRDELDVVILSANDGKLQRNLTGGFTNRYEEIVTGAFDGQRDLSWSPEGDRVAFFVRKENRRPLLIYDPLSGKRLDEIETGIDNCFSPAFSPDGTKIAFSGNRNGIVDIFVVDLATKEVRNATDDPYFDTNPSWSPDGAQILYDRRIGLFEKIFLVEAGDPAQKRQLTFGESNDLMPVFGREPGTILFSSDRWAGIYNICKLDTQTLEVGRLTDLVGGGFAPVQLADKDGKPQAAYVGYSQGTFRLYRMEIQEPAEKVGAEAPTGAPEALTYTPELNLSLDEAEKKVYRKKWSVDAPSITVGAANDGTVFTNSNIIFSDLLGDYRILLNLSSVSSYSNMDVLFLNLKRRLQWGAEAFDFRDYYLAAQGGGVGRLREATRLSGLLGYAQYPLNRYYRFEGQAGYVSRSLTRPVGIFGGRIEFQKQSDAYALGSFGFSGDTTRFKSFGPYHGKRFELNVSRGQMISGDTGDFTNYSLDFRGYLRMTRRSLIALRLYGLASVGDGAGLYAIGGYNELRGYDFRELFGNRIYFMNLELRYPLIDELRFPFGAFRELRGTIFFDAGTAYFNDNFFYSQKLQSFRPFGRVEGGFLVDPQFEKFKLWDTDNNRPQDLRASWGLGFHFLLFGLEWHWDFAHQFPYTDFGIRCLDDTGTKISCRSVTDVVAATELRKVKVGSSAVRTNFWIGFSF